MEMKRKLLFLCSTFIIIFNFRIDGIETNQVAPLTNVKKSELNCSKKSIGESMDGVVSRKIQFETELNHLVVNRMNGNVSSMPIIIDSLIIIVNLMLKKKYSFLKLLCF